MYDDSGGGIFGGEGRDFGGSLGGSSRPSHETPAYLKQFANNQTRAAAEEA